MIRFQSEFYKISKSAEVHIANKIIHNTPRSNFNKQIISIDLLKKHDAIYKLSTKYD